MNRAIVDRIVNAVLYEGYILYPYRPSVKNRQRWTFGGLYPEAYSRAQAGSDAWSNQTACLIQGNAETILEVTVRFLHLTNRIVGEVSPPLMEWRDDVEPPFRPVEMLQIGDQTFHAWQEAEEREFSVNGLSLGELLAGPQHREFSFPGRRWLEPVRGPGGEIAGVLVREQQTLQGTVEINAASLVASAPGELYKLTCRVLNRTPLEDLDGKNRDDALLRAFVSTHTILGVQQGEFVSLMDPPDAWRETAAECLNIGTWPVLVGEGGQRDTMLSSPIILYDYPQVAAESPGELFDGTEIDEILTLRILTLTEEEKQAAAAVDGRARELLARTESLAREQLMGLHGTLRKVRPSGEENING